MPIIVQGTKIVFNDSTEQTTAGKTGTVTSIATGNGLQGGTITTSGTLSVACPSYNTVGSYCYGAISKASGGSGAVSGSTYAAGTSTQQIQAVAIRTDNNGYANPTVSNNLSGTWRWMSGNYGVDPYGDLILGIACRVT